MNAGARPPRSARRPPTPTGRLWTPPAWGLACAFAWVVAASPAGAAATTAASAPPSAELHDHATPAATPVVTPADDDARPPESSPRPPFLGPAPNPEPNESSASRPAGPRSPSAEASAAPGRAAAAPLDELERVLALRPGPSLEALQRAAVRRAQLDPARARRWLRASRRAALLPDLDASWEHRLGGGWRYDQEVGDPAQLSDDRDQADVWRVSVDWELDRLWFNPDELRAARSNADLGRWRRELLAEVTTLYFERARALAEWSSSADPNARLDAELRLLEFEGRLTALTGLTWP